MARENAIENVRSIDNTPGELVDAGERAGFDDVSGTAGGIDIDCPNCDHRFGFGEWTRTLRGERIEPSCPTCGESFSVRVGSEFALVERDGWAVSASVGHEGPRR